MANPPNTGDHQGLGATPEPTTGAPRWVKVLGMVALALAVLFVILMLTGGEGHGPGRHIPAGGDHAPSSSVTGQGVRGP